MLIKGAYIVRRHSYEQLAFYVSGPVGKFLVEIMTILFLLSTLVAFFVVIGDLGPDVIEGVFLVDSTNGDVARGHLRLAVMILVALFVILPLSLLRNIEHLSHVSSLALVYYAVFILKMFAGAIPSLSEAEWIHKVTTVAVKNLLTTDNLRGSSGMVTVFYSHVYRLSGGTLVVF